MCQAFNFSKLRHTIKQKRGENCSCLNVTKDILTFIDFIEYQRNGGIKTEISRKNAWRACTAAKTAVTLQPQNGKRHAAGSQAKDNDNDATRLTDKTITGKDMSFPSNLTVPINKKADIRSRETTTKLKRISKDIYQQRRV